jgi:hypothetical protein
MPDNQLAPPDMPWLFTRPGQPNALGPPMLNYAAPPDAGGQTLGSAVADTGANAWQWLQDQREESVRQGLLDPDTGLPTQKGLVQGVGDMAQGVMMGTTAPGIRAYHGSPHSFEAFDTSKIGTGEGAQAYGHGLYFAEGEGVARSYRDALGRDADRLIEGTDIRIPSWVGNRIDSGAPATELRDQFISRINEERELLASGQDPQPWLSEARIAGLQRIADGLDQVAAGKAKLGPPGSMYEVNIAADPEHFLHWDKPLSEQHPVVQQAVKDAGLVDPSPRVEWQGDPSLWELHQNGRPTGTMLEDAGDGRTYNEIVNGKLTGSIPKQSVDAWKDMHAQSLRDAYREPDPTGRDLIKNNPGIEKELHTIGLPGIRYLDQGSRGAGQGTHNYVVFDAKTIDILRKYGIAGLIAGAGAAAAGTQQQQPTQ